jgi:hypothetical protein
MEAPYQPKLCRRWWDPVHQRQCGNVSEEAIRRALELDTQRSQPKERKADTDSAAIANPIARTLLRLFGER